MKGLIIRSTRALGVVVASLGFTALSGAPAHAAVISTDACDNAALTQPFQAWGDSDLYKPAPGGFFQAGDARWTLSSGASIVSGGEPWNVSRSAAPASLKLTAGASAQSPFTCVDAAYPTLRFFGRTDGIASAVLVSVVYDEPLLGQVAVPVGADALSSSWAPSAPMLTASAVTAALANGTTGVALRFTELTGTSQIDDVYVDPRMS